MKRKGLTVLVVDDEVKIVEVVKSYLENAGYKVIESFDGKDALLKFERYQPGLIILDLMLPDITGEEVCSRIRKKSHIPIIMLTAKVAEEELLHGLGMGADDYITKPFSPRELLARVEALWRRSGYDTVPLTDLLTFNTDDLVIDNLRHEVRKRGEVVNLTPNEYNILMALVKYPNKTFTREELVVIALGEDFEGYQRTIDAHIKNLRQKIEDDTKLPLYIKTVHGVGYRFGGEPVC